MKQLIPVVLAVLLGLPLLLAGERISLPTPLPQKVVEQPPQVTDVLFIGLRPSPAGGGVVKAMFEVGYYVPGEATIEDPSPDEEFVKVRRFFVTWSSAEWQAKLTGPERAAVRKFMDALKTDAEAKVAQALARQP